jgi:SAM-dependent methyltransferase
LVGDWWKDWSDSHLRGSVDMRKGYFPDTIEAGPSYWQPLMDKSLENAVKYCEIDYYRSIFLEYFPRTGRILEGGCRIGHYVIYCRNLGYDIYGVDRVIGPLCQVKQYQPHARVSSGDVRQLPFKSKTFKAYFSNGVAEHFEEGPSRVLREAHRVLDDDGLLVIAVPQMNIKRRLEDFLHFTLKRKPLRTMIRPDGIEMVYKQERVLGKEKTLVDGYDFHTYCFTRREFTSFLEQSGFRVLRSHGLSVEYGLLEFPFLRTLYRRVQVGTKMKFLEGVGGSDSHQVPKFLLQKGVRQRLKKLIVSETPEYPATKLFLRLLQLLFGHLMLFVCEKAP